MWSFPDVCPSIKRKEKEKKKEDEEEKGIYYCH